MNPLMKCLVNHLHKGIQQWLVNGQGQSGKEDQDEN